VGQPALLAPQALHAPQARRFLKGLAASGQAPAPAPAALAAMKALLGDVRIEATPSARRVFAAPGLAGGQPGLLDRIIHKASLDAGASPVTSDGAAAYLTGARLLDA